MKLILPKIEMSEAFKVMVGDYEREEEWEYYFRYEEGLLDMDEYLERLRLERMGIDIPEGRVPTTLYWLVDEGETEIRGNLRIRHEAIPVHGNIGYDVPPSKRMKGYGRELLRLGLIKAREMGIEDVRVTCSEENEASRRIIEANGGRFLEKGIDEGEVFLQYVIEGS